MSYVDDIRKATADALGDDGDYSYITEELLASIDEAGATQKDAGERDASVRTVEDVNSLINRNGRWEFRELCNPAPWFFVTNLRSQSRLPNCANGFIHHRIGY